MTLSPADLAAVARDVQLGLSLRDACAAAGVPYQALRAAVGNGARAKGGKAREVYLAVREAQAKYRRQVQAAILVAAKKGAPGALERLCDRLDSMAADLEPDPPEDPLEFARWRLEDVQRRMSAASGIAYNQLVQREADLKRQVADLLAATEAKRRAAASLAALSADESMARLIERIQRLDDAALRDLLTAASADLARRGLAP